MILPDLTSVWQLKPGLRLVPITNTAVLVGEQERFALAGTAMLLVLSLLDGARTIAEVLDVARVTVSEPEAFFALSQLASNGLVVPCNPRLDCQFAAFWHGLQLDAQQVDQALRTKTVSVHSFAGERLVDWMTDALRQVGIIVDRSARTRVLVTDDYLNPSVSQFCREFAQDGAAWCIVKPTGTRPLIGPFFDGHGGPCCECLQYWIRRNRPVEELATRVAATAAASTVPPASGIEASMRAACTLAALALAQAVSAPADHALRGRLLAIDLGSLLSTAHVVVRRPQCPACGTPGLMRETGERPILLQPVSKAYCEDGGFRCMSPSDTYARYRHLVSPICGAVTHLHPMPGRCSDLRPVYASGYLVCPQNDDLRGNPFDKICAGKGRTAEQSKVSALCEALERWSGVYQGDEACLYATLQELGSAAIEPNRIMGFSQTQYRDRDAINAKAFDRSQSVPLPLRPTDAIAWTPGWSLTHETRRFIPLAYCYDEAPRQCGTDYCRPGYNGAAAGNCLEEAILQGLLEMIERDAVGIWWYNRIARPSLDVGGLAEPYFASMRADYEQRGWRHWILDLTHDLGIPVCAALAYEPSSGDFAVGFGCHLQQRLAALRAVTELSQLFHPTVRQRWNVSRLCDSRFLFAMSDSPVPAVPHADFSGTDLRQDLETCMQRLHAAGLELVVVDKTRPDIQLCVAQVIVPGLAHMWQRTGSQRLYRVPCELGWLAQPRTESELTTVALLA